MQRVIFDFLSRPNTDTIRVEITYVQYQRIWLMPVKYSDEERKELSQRCKNQELYDKDQEIIWQGTGGYMIRIIRLYYKDQKVIIYNPINSASPDFFVGLVGIGKSGDWQKPESYCQAKVDFSCTMFHSTWHVIL